MVVTNVDDELTVRTIAAFAKAIKIHAIRGEMDFTEEAETAFSLAIECGYDWLKDEQFTVWMFGPDKPSRLDILIGAFKNTLEVCCETCD